MCILNKFFSLCFCINAFHPFKTEPEMLFLSSAIGRCFHGIINVCNKILKVVKIFNWMKVEHGKSIYCIAFPCTKLYFVSSHRAPSKYINSRGLRCRRKPYTSLNIFLLMFKIRSRFLLASGLILSLENDFHVWCIKTKNILISIRYTPCSVFNCFSLLKIYM